MNRTNRILPTYTGDVSGACSALYELGGMVAIHDPSGCNSTYNTHDETRWYDQDSLIFITGLTEREAILGDDDKLVHDVVDATRELRPRFVALCNSPIPFISGTDFPALCRLIEKETDVPCFYVRTNGMHDYVVGAGNAFLALAERCVRTSGRMRPGTANILGATPLDLGIAASDASLRSFVQTAGFDVTSCWAMGSSLDELARASEAQVNLVVSATGLAVAKWLREQFGTPFVVGTPVGQASVYSQRLADELHRAVREGACRWPCRDLRSQGSDLGRFVVGEPVAMGSIAASAELAGAEPLHVVSPLENTAELLGTSDVATYGEEEAERALGHATLVVADGLYAPVVPTDARHIHISHQAFSGRNSWSCACDLALVDPEELFGANKNKPFQKKSQ